MIEEGDIETFKYICRIVSPSDADMNLIFNMYKKYVNPGAAQYTTGCANCNGANSIVAYWRQLTKWFGENR